MCQFFEAMESRRLFAVTPGVLVGDAAAFEASVKTVGSDYAALNSQAAADLKALKAVEGKASASDKALLQTLTNDEKQTASAFKSANNSTTAALKRDGLSVLAIAKAIAKKPSAALQSKLTAAVTKLTTDSSGRQTTLLSDAANLNSKPAADLAAISNANSATTVTATTATGDLATGTQTLQNAINTEFAAVAKFIQDASA